MSPLTLLRLAPWAIAVLMGIGLLFYRGEYLGEKAARADDRARAEAAVIAQKEADSKLSADLLAQQRASLDALHTKALSSLKQVANAPVTSTCGPVLRASSHGVHDLLAAGAGQPPARP